MRLEAAGLAREVFAVRTQTHVTELHAADPAGFLAGVHVPDLKAAGRVAQSDKRAGAAREQDARIAGQRHGAARILGKLDGIRWRIDLDAPDHRRRFVYLRLW